MSSPYHPRRDSTHSPALRFFYESVFRHLSGRQDGACAAAKIEPRGTDAEIVKELLGARTIVSVLRR